MTSNKQDAIVLFGDSITQGGWEPGGFAQRLAYVYARKFDVINRGLSGYNTDWGLPIYKQILAKKSEQPHVPTMRILTIWFGANDAVLPHSPQYVPLPRFKDNLREFISLLYDKSSEHYHSPERTKVIFITPPPVDDNARAQELAGRDPPLANDREFENTHKYAKAVEDIGKELGIPVADCWTAIWEAAGKHMSGLKKYLPDGLHLNAASYHIVYDLILDVIEKNWPHLHYSRLHPVFPAWSDVDWNDPGPSVQARRC